MSNSSLSAEEIHARVMALQAARTNEEWQALIDRKVEEFEPVDSHIRADVQQSRVRFEKTPRKIGSSSVLRVKRAKVSKATVPPNA